MSWQCRAFRYHDIDGHPTLRIGNPCVVLFAVLGIHGADISAKTVDISLYKMATIIFQLVIVPLMVGMLMNAQLPALTKKLQKPVRTLSILIFFAFIVFALRANWRQIQDYVMEVFLLVFVHNMLALLAGYSWSRLHRLAIADVKAITFETGIQNAGLGLILVLNFFPESGGMALVAAWWGIWLLISAFSLSIVWSLFGSKPEHT